MRLVRLPIFPSVAATSAEVAAPRPRDDIVVVADVVMDRGFTVPAAPETVWPWLVQLGKRRAGWYLPAGVERFVPSSRRAARRIEARWQQLEVGDVIPDYGGRNETFEVALLEAPSTLVYRSRRGQVNLSWSINLSPEPAGTAHTSPRTRVHLRLRLGPVKHVWLADSGGELVDLLTIAGMAAGLRERLSIDA